MWEIGLLLVTGTLGAIAIRESRREHQRLQSLRDTAELRGLRVESTSIPFRSPLRIEARAGSTRVWIEDVMNGGQRLRLQVRVEIEGPRGFSGVRIRPEAERPSGAREIEIGDERFDSLFYVEGPGRATLAAVAESLEDDASSARAVARLGRAGSAAAVLPLKEVSQSSSELRRATRQAIAEIQSRLQGASPGQLSLAGADAGQLSLATDPAGQLSLPAKEPGQQPG